MKARKVWIAEHPDHPNELYNREVSFHDPMARGTHLYASGLNPKGDRYVEWKEFILIEVEAEL